ncbi:MAG TPA: ferrochelatase [Flavitalea sp.]|nr:ferrochelatase [Flavitalea sp.]
MAQAVKRGILLMNLGSPDSTSVKDLRKYLMEFLMDKRVIDKPYLLRLFLVGAIIVPFRAPKSAEAYKSIWTSEGSPLIVISRQLQAAVQEQVEEYVALAMRYGNPNMRSALDELAEKVPGLEEVVAVPLYPHYAMSSFETVVEHAKATHKKHGYPFKLSFIKPFYDDPRYIDALAESMAPYLRQEYDQVLFSYHGVPERHIFKGDITGSHCLKSEHCCSTPSPAHQFCYRHQCKITTRLVSDKLGIPEEKRGFSFQSRLGRDEWLKPYSAKRFEELPAEGVKKLLVVCPAFVSDCLETLEEVGVEGKHSFLSSGGEYFEMIPCLNVQPAWVNALVKWTRDADQYIIREA